MNEIEKYIEMTEEELEYCNGGGFFWVFVGGVWKLIDENIFH